MKKCGAMPFESFKMQGGAGKHETPASAFPLPMHMGILTSAQSISPASPLTGQDRTGYLRALQAALGTAGSIPALLRGRAQPG